MRHVISGAGMLRRRYEKETVNMTPARLGKLVCAVVLQITAHSASSFA